ncbi:MAG: 8-oxoguanine DNA glycosylase [Clostridiales bacterium]|nr:8-oxoguanine DNA glycosylase [Clostridiales bacterium]
MKFDYDSTYFNPKDVLECGQIFRFTPYKRGYKLFSKDLACYIYLDGAKTVVESENSDYFYNFFDLERDYASIIKRAKAFNLPVVNRACEAAKGLRLLNQDAEEMIFSFIISQNNNIPRIKSIIEKICNKFGNEREFLGEKYYTFPTAQALESASVEDFKRMGAGYRCVYLRDTAVAIAKNGIEHLKNLGTDELKKELLKFNGIGPKVADCISLFGFGKRQSFPVDTWIEKLYKQDFGGTLTDRNKINLFFTDKFKEDSGYIQQYLFYAKRENL